MKRLLIAFSVTFAFICSSACGTTNTVDDTVSGQAVQPAPSADAIPTVTVVPDEGCPDVEPDLTTVTNANLQGGELRISVRTTTWCNVHEFTLHRCDAGEYATTYLVSETNDCGVPNDGVIEHVLIVEREHLGDADGVETFDTETVTVTR